MPGGTTPAVVAVPEEPRVENVVYLPEHGTAANVNDPALAPNRRAYDYDGVDPPAEQPESAGPPMPTATPIRPLGVDPAEVRHEYDRARAAQVDAALPAFGSHGPTPQPHELVPPPRDPDNPFGDFFGDGPSAWLEDDDSEDEHDSGHRRVVGTLFAFGAMAMLAAAWLVWALALYRGAGGAEAGGFILLAMLLWIWYLSMPRAQQHRFMLRHHARVQGIVDRRTTRIRDRTEGQLSMRRERDRYRAMRDERTRRVNALGEGAYRAFRQGQLPADLHGGAQRVLGIERQMLTQDQHIHQLDAKRRTRDIDEAAPVADTAAHRGADPAVPPPHGGHTRP